MRANQRTAWHWTCRSIRLTLGSTRSAKLDADALAALSPQWSAQGDRNLFVCEHGIRGIAIVSPARDRRFLFQ
jgi:hypothetical protein